MNAIISKGDKTAHVQLPVERKQLAGALSYLGANHTSDYDLKYNEENKDGLKVSLECFGVVENAIAKALPVGFRFHTLNESLTLMGNLPYQNRREVENTIKVDGLDSYEQLNRMLTEAYPQSVTTKYYCPLTIQVHSRDCYGDIDEDGYEEDAAFAARHEDDNKQDLHLDRINGDGTRSLPPIRIKCIHVPRNFPILPSAIRFHVGSHRPTRGEPRNNFNSCLVPHQRTDSRIHFHACRRCCECCHSARRDRIQWRWLRWSRLEDLFRLCIPSRMAKRSCRYGAWSAYRRYLHTRL